MTIWPIDLSVLFGVGYVSKLISSRGMTMAISRETIEWAFAAVFSSPEAFERFRQYNAVIEDMPFVHKRDRSAAARKGWRTRKAMKKARTNADPLSNVISMDSLEVHRDLSGGVRIKLGRGQFVSRLTTPLPLPRQFLRPLAAM